MSSLPRGPALADLPQQTLDETYRRELKRLLSHARRHADSDAASDIVQEAFARAAASGQVSQLRNPGAFLQRIVHNLVIDRARRAAARPAHVPLAEDREGACPPSQHDEAVAAELLARYEAALDRLPEKTRRVFLMHRVDERTYSEIHEALGISIAGVEYHMMKALAHLARVLDVDR